MKLVIAAVTLLLILIGLPLWMVSICLMGFIAKEVAE